MICKVLNHITSQHFHYPHPGQWYSTPKGHVLRVCLVNRECQKVVCEPLGRNYCVSMPLIAFLSGRNFKRLGGAA